MLSNLWRTARVLTCTAVLYHAFVFFAGISPSSAVTVQVMKLLRQYHIIPDVIDVAPTSVVQVRYPNHVVVKIGGELNMHETAHKPFISWPAAEDGFYTLIMTDPDSPTPLSPKNREFQHWMVVNIPGCKVAEGEVKVDYIGPINDPEGGIHRYVYSAFRQKGKLAYEDLGFLTTEDLDKRANFSTIKFSEKYEFGYPVAVNFFRVNHKKSADNP